MAVPFLDPAATTGEVSPDLFGRIDLDRARIAGGTVRNMFVNYKGPVNSRGGTKYVGFSKQTVRNYGPRLIDFQFNINQGYSLEFGHEYVRFIQDGAYIVEGEVGIGGATQADPCVLTFGTSGASVASPIVTAVTFSYAPGDKITLLGGTFLSPAILEVVSSKLVSILANARGSGYAIADTITLGGGTFSAAAVVTVASVVPVAASGTLTFINNPSDADTITMNGVTFTFKTTATTGVQIQIQDTLAATLIEAAIVLNASASGSVNVATYGSTDTTITIVYDTTGGAGNAYTIAASVATPSGATLSGGTTTGLGTVTVTTPGVYTALPTDGNMTQGSTSGTGTGASLQTAVFGPNVLSIDNPGAYTTVPGNPVAQASTDGMGVGATFTMTWAAVAPFSNGDWVQVQDVVGMVELNGNTYILSGVTATTAQLLDVYGNPVDSSGYGAYVSGGTVARIYTLDTPYQEEDLRYLKFTQSADEMTLCCVNQETLVEYAPQNLIRSGNADWAFSDVVAVPTVDPPLNTDANVSDNGSTFYQYQITAVSPEDGTESIGSEIASGKGINIAVEFGEVRVTWEPNSPAVDQYNIYKAQPSYGAEVPVGALFGYIGSAYGAKFIDSNILPDFAQVPPRHLDPFARGRILGINIVTGGSGYTSSPTVVITTATGQGADIDVIVQSNQVVGVVMQDYGFDYADGDTIAFTGGGGAGATGTLVIGPVTGTYPSVPSYFQQRRMYANTINQPDTYFGSQPGAYRNFDARIPPIPSDALSGSPWAVQVDGIQWMIQIAGGLLTMTGQGAWVLVGTGSFAQNVEAFGPGSQDANPQPFTGASPIIPPIRILYDVIYVTAKGSYYYDLPYQGVALGEPTDITEYSSHLFDNHTVLEHAWCEQPNKLLWAVRDDGVMLSLTFLKPQAVSGWARHDTQGKFVSVCSVTEPPVDALYVAVKRNIGGQESYVVERMDNRLWQTIEDAWCVDCALSYPQPTPAADLDCDLPYGTGNLTGVTDLVGGSGYSDGSYATITDEFDGPGSGAEATLTIVAGVITAVTFSPEGEGYTNPKISVTDPVGTGSGFEATILLNTTATFRASAAVFEIGDIGSVIRMGGGIATINSFINAQTVTAALSVPVTDLVPNLPDDEIQIATQAEGTWTLTVPTDEVSGLGHLAGAIVTGLADGQIVTPRQVSATGVLTLDAPASAIVIGLGFTAQFQSVYADSGNAPTSQGQRKKVAAVNPLLDQSRDVEMGTNQPDGSTLSPPQIAPAWSTLQEVPRPDYAQRRPYNSATEPLYTGYARTTVEGGFQKPGQVALQQRNPVPLNLLALVSEVMPGDTPEMNAGQK